MLLYQYPGRTTRSRHCINCYLFKHYTRSFDHDGLGRYGDPLNPDGDLEAMRTVYRLIKPEGILFLTVPIGTCIVVFEGNGVHKCE